MLKETVLSRSIRLVCAGSIALTMHSAFAQTEDDNVTKVQVTGSRLTSPNAVSPSPLQILTSADIAASGATNLQELLLKNPTLGAPSISRTNSNFQTASVGVATIDLRNLGTSRTLVLVNGRRFVAGVPGESAVDMNTIPTDFIERVELLTGGASAAYGSDAVAGVVNIILKRNFNGVLVDASLGQSDYHDDSKKKLAVTFGTTSADGSSNIMGHFGYSKQGAVYSRNRPGTDVDNQSLGTLTGDPADIFTPETPFYSGIAPQGRFLYGSGKTAGDFTYDRAGNIIPWSTNGSATQAATGYNRNALRTIAVPTERFLFATNGNHAFDENHSAFFEGTYASTKVTSRIEPFGLQSKDIFPTAGAVPVGSMVNGVLVRNPLVPQYLYDRATDTNGDGIPDYTFSRRLSEVGTRGNTAERDTFRLATGLKGTIKDWNYEAFVSYGKTKEAQNSTGQVNVMSFRNALLAIPDGKGGAMCADPIARLQGCVPVNLFGFNSISPEALKYVTAPGSLITSTTQKVAGGNLSGELFQLPAGKVGLSGGVEWRQEESSSVADPLTQAGLNAGNAAPPTYGKFQVKEAYLETLVPILKDKFLAKQLDFRAAYRVGDYSTVGHTNSWNTGLEWAPTSDVKFRATRSISTRAPNINELYSPASQTFPPGISDPCKGVTATSTTEFSAGCRADPNVLANIQANGVFTQTQSDLQGISGYDRGNPNLKAEQGRSTTVGVVLTPRSIPMLSKFTFTADYFDIKISDAIVSTPRQYSLSQCYGGGNPELCKFITRRTATGGGNNIGTLSYIDSAVSNSGGLGTEGIDLTASWADMVGPGRLTAKMQYTYVKEGYVIPLKGEDKDPFAGEVGAAKNKANLNLAYKWGSFGISSTTTYIGRSSLDDQFLAQLDLPANSLKVGSRTYQDFQLTFDVKKQVQLYLGIDNAFDTSAPPILSGLPGNSTGTNTDAGTYDAIGRRYYAGLRVTM